MRQESLYLDCHSGLDKACPVLDTGESRISELDSRFRGNDGLVANLKKYETHYISSHAPSGFSMGFNVLP